MTFNALMGTSPNDDRLSRAGATARLHAVIDGHWSSDVLLRLGLRQWPDPAEPALEGHEVVALDDGGYAHSVDTGAGFVTVQFTPEPDCAPYALEHSDPPTPRWRAAVLTEGVRPDAPRPTAVAWALAEALRSEGAAFSDTEVATLWEAMPLLRRYATEDSALADWALIFRDHYVENSVGFLLAAERAGFSPQWIYALDKGDKTLRRDRVHGWFLSRGYRSATLDNSVVNGTATDEEVARARDVGADVDAFIRAARTEGRRVLMVDDGGIIALGSAHDRLVTEQPDAALELTVSGLKRISAADDMRLPVFNMARSEVKTHLAYNEIADSCVRRLRAIVPGEKFVGRRVLSLGFGTLGARIARALRAAGCRVTVVDTDTLALVRAAEEGFDTSRSARAALLRIRPFLILGTTGEDALTEADLGLLPDGVLLAGFATRDFSLLSERRVATTVTPVPGVGVRHTLPGSRSAILLGDGRSLNLFAYEGIPNRGYDAYRAATLIAAKHMCRAAATLSSGVHLGVVDEAVREAGLYDAYYETYLADTAGPAAGLVEDGGDAHA
ncbi:hypothetical protein ABZ858_20130 [Streptomyces sp. NPDC047017]|uniref:hypothetical protein n=1 Tax=Streptomyces sp. NPDC047017 TaxID=3155024 RepID=UPI00340B5CA1